MNDAEFRRSVEADARRAGMSADLAQALARHVGRRPPAGAPPVPPPRGLATRAHHAPGTQSTRNVNIDRLCALYGASAVAPDFKAARGIPLRAFAALLSEAVGRRAKVTPDGVERVRMALLARGTA